MDKRHLYHIWRVLRVVKPWYFLVAVIVFGALSLISLRHNNEHMVKLRDAVYSADQNGGDVETALRNLRSYIYAHMNTSLASGPNAVHPPIQLKYTYERLQQAQQAQLGQGSALYNQAQSTCEAQTAIGSEVIACIQRYLSDHGSQAADVPDDLYKFDFTSAKFSLDLAGWSIILTALAALGFVVSALYHWLFRKFWL